MRMRTKVIAAVAAIMALVAPASAVHAAPAYVLSLETEFATLYPATDGFRDTARIWGIVDAGVDEDAGQIEPRIRGAVTVAIGGRSVKTVSLSHAGYFSFTWNGRDANKRVLTGTATVTLRVDGQAPQSISVVVSPKKVVPVTISYRQAFWDGGGCEDAVLGGGSDPIHNSEKLCPLSYGSPIPDYAYTRVLGTKTSGGVFAFASFYRYEDKLKHSVFPVKTTITANFVQTGTGTSRIWVLSQYGPDEWSAGSNPKVAFSRSGTVTVTGTTAIDWTAQVYHPVWVVHVPATVTLKATFYTIKCTYYVLK